MEKCVNGILPVDDSPPGASLVAGAVLQLRTDNHGT